MELRRLGTTGIDVPAIGMGTWRTFDTTEDRTPIVDEALAVGINLFDSSPMYGRAQETLAEAIKGRRDQVIIATKVWTENPAEGRRQADQALSLYGLVDVYQVHNLVNVPTQLQMLERLKGEGKVRAVGATHYLEDAFKDLADLMRTGRLDMVQIPYGPIRREAESVILPLAEEKGLGVFVMSPLQGGILNRNPTAGDLLALQVQTWPQAVLKWIASDPRVSTVLTATQRPGRPTENATAGDQPFFDPDQRERVSRICAAG